MKIILSKFLLIISSLILVSLCVVGCSIPSADTSPQTIGFSDVENSYLIFYDDFTSETLNDEIWNVYGEDGNHLRRGGYWNKNQVLIQDNQLIIRTSVEDGKYQTGAITTKDKFENGYGFYEVRCKLPQASGIWSAFWLMSIEMDSGQNNSSDVTRVGAEIDVMESPYYKGLVTGDTYQCAVHVGNYQDKYIKNEKLISSNFKQRISLYDDRWHTFAVDWTEKGYKFYYDRQIVYEINDSKLISPLKNFLFLSVEVGGDKGVAGKTPFFKAGDVNKNSEGTFPVDFCVDWVAVYSQKPF